MASDSSFDVVSRVDQQELDNALNQTRKEIENRFDFKNSKTSIEYDGKKITLISDDELKMRNVVDIFGAKAVKRGIDLKAFEYGEVEPAAGSTVRQVVTLRSGIPKDQEQSADRRDQSLEAQGQRAVPGRAGARLRQEQGRSAEGHQPRCARWTSSCRCSS